MVSVADRRKGSMKWLAPPIARASGAREGKPNGNSNGNGNDGDNR
jgi:hypothetical protein